MMKRISEPDLMNDIVQAEAYAATDFSEPHDAFVTHFADRFPDFKSGSVLDLGCGTADVIIRFARAFTSTNITGIDGASAMLDIGHQEIERANLSDRIILNQYIMPCNELPGMVFDAVISNSLLHHLKDPFIMWDLIKGYAKNHAPVFVMDLMRPESKEKASELLEMYAADAPKILREDFYNSLLASYTLDEVREQLSKVGISLSVEAISDRHLIAWGVVQ